MRPAKGPRLYLRKARPDRSATWVIKDYGREFTTGCSAEDRKGANEAMQQYIAQRGRPAIGWDGEKYVDLTNYRLGLVYFISTREIDEFPIKVGFTDRLDARLMGLQVGCPFRLEVMATMDGAPIDEQRILRRFSHLRMCGEWLRRDAELLHWIAKLLNRGRAPDIGVKDGSEGGNSVQVVVENTGLSM